MYRLAKITVTLGIIAISSVALAVQDYSKFAVIAQGTSKIMKDDQGNQIIVVDGEAAHRLFEQAPDVDAGDSVPGGIAKQIMGFKCYQVDRVWAWGAPASPKYTCVEPIQNGPGQK
jgi:hypothetical protein